MEYRFLGQSGIQASVIGLGAWAMGGWMWGGTDEAKAIGAIHASLDAGVTLIDTAPAYGLGLSESIVGRAIKGRRDKVVLATKCGLVWHVRRGTFFFEEDGKPVYRCLAPDSIRYEVEESLRRLGTDYIDLYQSHWQDPTTPIEDTMAALLELKREGKIRAIGVSNCTLGQLVRYRSVGPVDSAQEKYSMLDRGLEADFLPYCREHQIAVLAYSPLALGLLTGKIGPERRFPPDDQRSHHPRFRPEALRRTQGMLARLQPIAQKHGLTMTQLVIAWTISQPGISHALVGARDDQQALENASAGSVVLSGDDLAQIDEVLKQHTAGGTESA